MSKMVQIRDVSDRVHSALKARAAREGMNLSDLIKRELEHTVERPSMQEWLERGQKMKPIPTKQTSAQLIRDLRNER